jgi:hypothetical protein
MSFENDVEDWCSENGYKTPEHYGDCERRAIGAPPLTLVGGGCRDLPYALGCMTRCNMSMPRTCTDIRNKLERDVFNLRRASPRRYTVTETFMPWVPNQKATVDADGTKIWYHGGSRFVAKPLPMRGPRTYYNKARKFCPCEACE